MTLLNPYEAPQSTLTTPHLNESKKLPAIVGVGSTLTFWSTSCSCLFYITSLLLVWFDNAADANGLFRLLEGLTFWIIPIPTLLGYFLLLQVPETTGAKSCFKWTMILYAAHWSWLIVLFYEKHPEEVPVGINLFFNLVGTAANLTLCYALLQLNRYCEDALLIRWSKLSLFFGSCNCLLMTIDDGLRIADPQFVSEVPAFALLGSTPLYELFWFAQWITWLGMFICNCRILWRIPAHAELEARPKAAPTENAALLEPERVS